MNYRFIDWHLFKEEQNPATKVVCNLSQLVERQAGLPGKQLFKVI